MIDELLQDIQTFLHEERGQTSDEAQAYEQLLAEFYQIPSYVERFTQDADQERTNP